MTSFSIFDKLYEIKYSNLPTLQVFNRSVIFFELPTNINNYLLKANANKMKIYLTRTGKKTFNVIKVIWFEIASNFFKYLLIYLSTFFNNIKQTISYDTRPVLVYIPDLDFLIIKFKKYFQKRFPIVV